MARFEDASGGQNSSRCQCMPGRGGAPSDERQVDLPVDDKLFPADRGHIGGFVVGWFATAIQPFTPVVTDTAVRRLYSLLNSEHTLADAARKAGVSE